MRLSFPYPASAVALSLAAVFLGCSGLGYYVQAGIGGLGVLRGARPIARVVGAPETSPELKRRLALVQELRRFSIEALDLPDNESYRRYADLGRPYAVWTVTAAPEFSLTPRNWCFPVTGCVSYRGYFSERRARRFARRLARRGLDVEVSGVAAYSTLGWFRDPVLNTFVGWSEEDLGGLLFHELAHQVVFVKGDTVFNESFATFVERLGVRRWLESAGEAERLAAWKGEIERRDRRVEVLLETRDRLATLYAGGADVATKRERKAEILASLERRLGGVKSWNNAGLASVEAYHGAVPVFEALYEASGGRLETFYEVVRRRARLGADLRLARPVALVASADRP